MATNLLKKYNEPLDLLGSNMHSNLCSLKGVFNRDITNNNFFAFRTIQIQPTTADGEDKMERLFRHLTTVIVDEKTSKREFEIERSIRLHWIKYHIEEKKKNILVFSVPFEKRTYILDKEEKYVIILEPLRNVQAFYLLTAYKLFSSNYKKILNKYEKSGKDGLL